MTGVQTCALPICKSEWGWIRSRCCLYSHITACSGIKFGAIRNTVSYSIDGLTYLFNVLKKWNVQQKKRNWNGKIYNVRKKMKSPTKKETKTKKIFIYNEKTWLENHKSKVSDSWSLNLKWKNEFNFITPNLINTQRRWYNECLMNHIWI